MATWDVAEAIHGHRHAPGQPDALDGDYIKRPEKGVASGVATLDGGGNVPLAELGNVPANADGSNVVMTDNGDGTVTVTSTGQGVTLLDNNDGTVTITS